ncbi:hypothetical protein ACFUTV_38630 [Streptomyces sp. NPDC057298]|uniref:hypothetical protein n=1 Tax=Streptomyces sp. NPDC057298 TaxID=3346091 RepID=UPI00362D3F44
MPNPRLYAGQIITADKWNSLIPQLVQQETDQIVTASTTFVNSEITFTPEPNAMYWYELLIAYSAIAAADFKWTWAASGTTLCSFTAAYAATAATSSINAGSDVILRRPANTTVRIAGGSDATSPPANFHSAYDRGTFTTDGTISPVTMQFAQNVSDAGQTILRGGNQTRLMYYRIG